MRLVTYRRQGFTSIGIHMGTSQDPSQGKIIDIPMSYSALDLPGNPVLDMLTLIRRYDTVRPLLERISDAAKKPITPGSRFAETVVEASQVQFMSPVPEPLSMRDGYAFRQHVEAARRNRGVPMIDEFDAFPIYYYTNHLAVSGSGEIPVREAALEKLDFELEVAIVIGKEGRNIPASKADEYIFGYMIMNDWSARALQMEEMKLNLGPAKGKDFSTSLGPYLVTRDELASSAVPGPKGERHDLKMRAWIGDKLFSEGNLKDISWTFAQIIERISYGVTLKPGEVIGSGTVGTGCLLELNGNPGATPYWLKVGDQVTLEIDRLGKLVNTIVAEKV